MDSDRMFDIEAGKKDGLVRTDILDKFIKDGKMEIIGSGNDGRYIKTTYKISKGSKGSEMFIFKSIFCPLRDSEGQKNLMKGYGINLKCSELTKKVVKPLNVNRGFYNGNYL